MKGLKNKGHPVLFACVCLFSALIVFLAIGPASATSSVNKPIWTSSENLGLNDVSHDGYIAEVETVQKTTHSILSSLEATVAMSWKNAVTRTAEVETVQKTHFLRSYNGSFLSAAEYADSDQKIGGGTPLETEEVSIFGIAQMV